MGGRAQGVLWAVGECWSETAAAGDGTPPSPPDLVRLCYVLGGGHSSGNSS